MLLFWSEEHIDRWCKFRDLPWGGTMSLDQAWRLARAWNADKLSADWRHRSVDKAEALVAEIGLTGPFCNLRP